MLRFSLTIFTSAFLLFAVQPMIGKYILPWFGGTPGVWTTCMLMFQLLLLGGYAYAHGLASFLKPRQQALVHGVLLLVSLALLPVTPSDSWKPADGQYPEARILLLIAATVGLPYFVLSTTGPLLQSWFARSYPGMSPYRLYSLSNVGSLLALLGYPLLVEPQFRLSVQTISWSVGYAGFVLACGWCAWRLFNEPAAAASPLGDSGLASNKSVSVEPERAPTWEDMLFWLCLSACGSVLLLAITNQISQEVAVVPFLWVMPLALYLVTFILCFDHPRWYHRGAFGVLWWMAILIQMFALTGGWSPPGLGGIDSLVEGLNKLAEYLKATNNVPQQIAQYALLLFTGCMLCHGELSRSKPSSRHLTLFFLIVSAGGALGGLLVALGAPVVFNGYWEFHVSIVVGTLLFYWALFRDKHSSLYHGKYWEAWAPLVSALLVMMSFLNQNIRHSNDSVLERSRNFYGVLRVWETLEGLDEVDQPILLHTLIHGTIIHGVQFVDPPKSRQPTSYYSPDSGLGMAILKHPRRQTEPAAGLHIGVVGLGTGTIAVYGTKPDRIRFYEINPEVIRLCDKHFTYRKDTPAKVTTVLGDARLQMEYELARGESQQFDVLAIDAFSSDAIPIHLLTRECFAIYQKHMRPDGILVVHVSNRHLDLKPIVRALGNEGHKEVIWINAEKDADQHTDTSNWLLVTSNQDFLDQKSVAEAVIPFGPESKPPLLWTDDFAALLQVLDKNGD